MEPSQPESMAMDEVNEKYRRLWLAVKVVERDEESGQPLIVKVLSSDLDSFGLRNKLYTEKEVCTFYTGPIPDMDHLLML